MTRLRSTVRRFGGTGLAGPKITRTDIQRFQDTITFGDRTLVVFADLPVPTRAGVEFLPDHKNAGEVHRYLEDMGEYADGSFDTVVATGLLEHLPDPEAFLVECCRLLRTGGRLYLRASCVFPVHVGPDDYFHVTQFGLELLLRRAGLEPMIVQGSSAPFRTLAILTQRIMLQCSLSPVVRPPLRAMVGLLPHLDRFVRDQFMATSQQPHQSIDAFMPSNIEAVAAKPGP
jgi:SAM-dependent methyltransferase